MFVTTVERTNAQLNQKAKESADKLGVPYVERKKRTIKQLQAIYQKPCIVIGKARTEMYDLGSDKPLFFHPNMAAIRMKRIERGESDPFLVMTGLREGMTLLDCTMGMAADAWVAAFAVGEAGRVTGLEINPYIHFIMNEGRRHYEETGTDYTDALKRIDMVQADYHDFLHHSADNSYDVVYLDPMFTETVEESAGLSGLRGFASYQDVQEEAISHAKRVARKRVVLKDHFRSHRFEKYGFTVEKRKSAKFHYGVIELNH
ncbi:class I SAM-dependent methyltransferase [Pradoshia sp.]